MMKLILELIVTITSSRLVRTIIPRGYADLKLEKETIAGILSFEKYLEQLLMMFGTKIVELGRIISDCIDIDNKL